MDRCKKVLAVTKRTADLCATQTLLYSAGYELITATNVAAAQALIRSVPIRGIIICHHSWTESERADIAAQLLNAELPVVRCPGCTGCDETRGIPGTLDNVLSLTSFISKTGSTEP